MGRVSYDQCVYPDKMKPQVVELPRKPHPSQMARVINAPTVRDEEMRALLAAVQRGTLRTEDLLTRGGYGGNKPSGGLWTSTYTPEDQHPSDWIAGLRALGSLTAASARMRAPGRRRLFVLEVTPTANVLEIGTLPDAAEFTASYRLHRVPSIRALSPILTAEVTDWASVPFDGVHVSGELIDRIAYALKHGESIDSAFHTWMVESTLWLRWSFSSVRELPG